MAGKTLVITFILPIFSHSKIFPHTAYHISLRGPQPFRITLMALEITWIHCWNQGIKWKFLNQESQFQRLFCIFSISLNHVMHKPLFSKQESQESIRNLGIKPKFQRFQNHVNENLELRTPRICSD